jgi:hypothetical protein
MGLLWFPAALLIAAFGWLYSDDTEHDFVCLFDGKTLAGWQGDTEGYVVEPGREGILVCKKGGKIFTEKEYGDFIFRFEFKLEANGNNGVGIRTPLEGNPAYVGMEIQILDNSGSQYQKLQPYQYHGSIYGVVPAKRGFMKPVGQWNDEEIMCKGSHVRVTLNGEAIVDADLSTMEKPMDGQQHPGLKRDKGYIGFLGHGSRIEFRNIRIKEL